MDQVFSLNQKPFSSPITKQQLTLRQSHRQHHMRMRVYPEERDCCCGPGREEDLSRPRSFDTSLSRSISLSSRFEECFDQDCEQECRANDVLADHECVLERHQDDEWTWDRSSVQEAYDEALDMGQEGNAAFHRHKFGDAIERYGHSMLIIENLETKNCDGTRPYDSRLDIKMTALAFTIMVNTAASFLDFSAYDHCEPILGRRRKSRYEEALECTRVAIEVLEQSQHQNPVGSHWRPNRSDWARLYKVKAAAYQGIGDHEKVLCNCRRVLEHSPCDQSCRKYVERCETSCELNVEELSKRLEGLRCPDSGPDEMIKTCDWTPKVDVWKRGL